MGEGGGGEGEGGGGVSDWGDYGSEDVESDTRWKPFIQSLRDRDYFQVYTSICFIMLYITLVCVCIHE